MYFRRIAVIIPFYQRETGILRRAVTGVLNQALPANLAVHVFIIDDSSPQSPDADLAELPMPDAISMSVHRQANAGPGGARNYGLDLAQQLGCDFVAFLDSDDVWRPPHLADALSALDQGYDIYFCDNRRDGAHERYNDHVLALANSGSALRSKAAEISVDGPVLGFAPGALAAEMVAACLCYTSAVVARESTMSGRRFDVEQRTAGEDHLFWIGLALDELRIMISWKCNVDCGRGVDIFFSAFDWNEPSALERVGHLLLLSEKLKRLPGAMELSGQSVRRMRSKYRRAYGFLFLRTLLRGRIPGTESLKKVRRFDPWLPLRLPLSFAQVLLDRSPEGRRW